MQPTLFDWSRTPQPLAAHLERLRLSGPARWRPSRLILLNYWLFGYEVFHFVHGRLVLRGANATGKSTVLASAVTLALDGEKRRERMDTFGGQGRSVAYYLVGDPKAGPDSDFYYDERTGYVALEFEHGGTGEVVTVGLGMHTSRSRPDLAVDSWGFVIRDGRRVGYDLQLHSGGPEPVPLGARLLREVLGAGGTVVDRTAEYQDLVNRTLFGFDSAEQYRFLLSLLLQLRSPKLNKDIRPSDVCDLLTRSLPPLPDELLDQVTQVIEDIDDCLESLATTAQHLDAVRELDQLLAHYLNQLAQQAAVAYREAHAELDAARNRHAEVHRKLADQQAQLATLDRQLAAVAAAQQAAKGRLSVLEQHQALQDQRQLETVERDLAGAEVDHGRNLEAVAAAGATLARLAAQRDRLSADWQREVDEQRSRAAYLVQLAAEADWPLAEDRAGAVQEALGRVSLDEPDSGPAGTLQPELLSQAGKEREAALRVVLDHLQQVQAAEREHDLARARVDQARAALGQADATRQKAETALEEARDAVSADLYAWRGRCAELPVNEPALQAVLAGVHAYAEGSADPRALLAPVEEVAATRRRDLQRQADACRNERAALASRWDELKAEQDEWLHRPEAEPPRRPGQTAARRLLAERGISAVPLYAACDFVPDLPPALASALEEHLDEAGLLDALVVPAGRAGEVAALLGPAGLGDRWLAPGAAAAGRTLADFLAPVTCAVPEADVLAALSAVAVRDEQPGAATGAGAALWATGGWQVGLLAGTATRRPEPAVLYIGAANRRRERDRQVARLQAALDELADQMAGVDARLATLDGRMAAIDADVAGARSLPALSALQQAAVELAQTQRWLTQRQSELEAAGEALEVAYGRLRDARAAAEESLRLVPEARGRNRDGIMALLTATRQAVEVARALAGQLRHLATLRNEYAAALTAIAGEEQRQALAQAAAVASERRVAELTARRDAIQEHLAALGVTVQEVLKQISDLRQRLEELHDEEVRQSAQRGATASAVERLQADAGAIGAAVQKAEAAAGTAAAALEQRLTAYPSLERALLLYRSGTDGPLAAAAELLKLRRSTAEDLARQVAESVREAERDLTRAAEGHRSLLVDYHLNFDGDWLYFRDQGARLLPYQLLTQLQAHQALQQQVLREKESQLYEDFILRQVASAIRERIARAEEWRDEVNRLLADRKLSNDEILLIVWRPLPPDRLTGAHPGRVVELLRRDVETLTDAEVKELMEHFRQRVAEVRDQERRSALETSFGEALRAVLDYRRWFAFALYAKVPGQDRVELTDTRFTARSGAEKSLAMFIPLLAAAHARFASAAPDAPKLVGLDEAFAGVDEQNTREMFRFLVELDFAWIMTSEKLWGVADTLPGCATYELVRRGSVVTPILYLWDGRKRHGSLDQAVQEVAAGEE